jgi:hypothetical protein
MENLRHGLRVGAAGLVLALVVACGGNDEKDTWASADGTPGGDVTYTSGASATPGAGEPAGELRIFGAPKGVTMGQIEQIDGTRLMLSDPGGKRTVNLTDATEVRQVKPASASDVKQGQQVSVTGAAGPDGRTQARMVEIAPPATPDGQPTGYGVTEGTVESVSGDNLRVRTANGSFVFVLTGETEYRQTVAARASDLQEGQWVMAAGEEGADGVAQARTVTITPPPTRRVVGSGPGSQAAPPDKQGTATPGAGGR